MPQRHIFFQQQLKQLLNEVMNIMNKKHRSGAKIGSKKVYLAVLLVLTGTILYHVVVGGVSDVSDVSGEYPSKPSSRHKFHPDFYDDIRKGQKHLFFQQPSMTKECPPLSETTTSSGSETCDDVLACHIDRTLPNGSIIARATCCTTPDRWLNEYIEEEAAREGTSSSYLKGSGGISADNKFLAMYFGCNKGFDAMETAERISRKPEIFGKDVWNEALGLGNGGMCGQGMGHSGKYDASKRKREVEVHCIEALPHLAQLLAKASLQTTAAHHGFVVHNYAISGTPGGGKMLFPDVTEDIGREGESIDHCKLESMKDQCVEVPMATIDEYVSKYVDRAQPRRSLQEMVTGGTTTMIAAESATVEAPATETTTSSPLPRIPFLSIDIEGYDYTAMMAAPETLARTDYLEFEYHSNSPWNSQKLEDAIGMLKGYGFTCYWAGRNQLWRITNCWRPQHEMHAWSNVACVNAGQQPKLAQRMEHVFRETLKEDVKMAP